MNQPNKMRVAVLIALGLGLAACQKQSDSTTQAASDTQASAPVQQPKPSFSADIQTVKVNLPECKGESCPEFQVQRLNSNVPEINRVIDQAILKTLKDNLDFSESAASDASATQPSQERSSDAFGAEVIRYANTFEGMVNDLKKMGASPQISLHIQPKVMPSPEGLVTIQLNADNFLGGAHGAASQQYFTFELAHPKSLKLDDVLEKNQKPALEKLAYAQFKQWVVSQKLSDNLANYEQTWPFTLSRNFYFDDKGLTLQYAQYEIGPYVVGMPSFSLTYAQLKGIVKPQYLPKVGS
ncbi:RsiV family protein [Acinetobacter sp. MD2]|uniref:RsiV family protein n=1 Tax=Acinetobacter sp. MD2 TaxID=2600066 RepID=UPI002D1F0CFD|nr:RsiV family protein [Acinetobacter sp. MD2]MEB3767417.1 DUF3298 domain-containing protein [Acinetobacter sp. MD2]